MERIRESVVEIRKTTYRYKYLTSYIQDASHLC